MFSRALKCLQPLAHPGGRCISTSLRRSAERSVNRVQLLGRIGSDPKQHGAEKTIVSFPLATTFSFKVTNEDGSITEKSRTHWHLINVRPPQTQQYVLNYAGRGCRVYVSGRLEYGRSQKDDGTTRELAIVASDEVILLSTPKSTSEREESVKDEFDEM